MKIKKTLLMSKRTWTVGICFGAGEEKPKLSSNASVEKDFSTWDHK